MCKKLDHFKQYVAYNPETGVFTWLSGNNRRKAGAVAGSFNVHGYMEIRVGGLREYAHRLAWAFINGAIPKHIVDHADGNPANNKWANLRKATPSESSWNVGRKSVSASGVKGVTWHVLAKKWDVRVRVAGAMMRERHESLIDAAAAAMRLRKMFHGEFANHNSKGAV